MLCNLRQIGTRALLIALAGLVLLPGWLGASEPEQRPFPSLMAILTEVNATLIDAQGRMADIEEEMARCSRETRFLWFLFGQNADHEVLAARVTHLLGEVAEMEAGMVEVQQMLESADGLLNYVNSRVNRSTNPELIALLQQLRIVSETLTSEIDECTVDLGAMRQSLEDLASRL